MKTEAMAVLVLARQKAKAMNAKPKLWDRVSQTKPVPAQTMGGRSGSGSRPSVCC
jgi:hypothetical protein